MLSTKDRHLRLVFVPLNPREGNKIVEIDWFFLKPKGENYLLICFWERSQFLCSARVSDSHLKGSFRRQKYQNSVIHSSWSFSATRPRLFLGPIDELFLWFSHCLKLRRLNVWLWNDLRNLRHPHGSKQPTFFVPPNCVYVTYFVDEQNLVTAWKVAVNGFFVWFHESIFLLFLSCFVHFLSRCAACPVPCKQ